MRVEGMSWKTRPTVCCGFRKEPFSISMNAVFLQMN